MKYLAHYLSPRNDHPENGEFEFESEGRLNSKQNLHDARVRMLELFGNDALSFTIDRVSRPTSKTDVDVEVVQQALDFREPKKTRRHNVFERGRVK